MTTPNAPTAPTATAAPQTAPAAATSPAAPTPGTQPAASGDTPAPAAPPKPAALPPEVRQAIIENTKLKQQLKQLEERGKATAADLELIAKLRDPKQRFAVARELLPYEDYTQHVLSEMGTQQSEPAQLPPEVVEKLKRVDELAAAEQARKEAAESEKQRKSWDEKVTTVRAFIDERAEALPMTKALEQTDSFLRAFLQETESNGGVPPDGDDFATRYEQNLATTVEKQLEAIAASSKGKALLQRLLGATAPTTANPTQPEPTQPTSRTPRAVTNGLSAEPTPATDPRALPAKDLQKRAARHFSS